MIIIIIIIDDFIDDSEVLDCILMTVSPHSLLIAAFHETYS